MIKTTPTHHPLLSSKNRRQAGFTLMEGVISLAVATVLILGVLAVFDINARVARVQTDLSDAQQSARVAQDEILRLTRMAGRGGLAQGGLPLGIAVVTRNNVGEDETIDLINADTPEVLDSTDVLTIRGGFSNPVYQVRASAGAVTWAGPATAPTGGTVRVLNSLGSDGTGYNGSAPQDLRALIEAVEEERPEALILVSARNPDLYAVVELDPGASDVSDPSQVTIAFRATGGAHTADYVRLNAAGVFPPELSDPSGTGVATDTGVALLAILEEYRYFVRELRVDDDLVPVLNRARTYPGTSQPWDGNVANWSVAIAENVFDLQVSYGIDRDGDGLVADGDVVVGLAKEADEILYNHVGDQPGEPEWAAGDFAFLRLNTLVRTNRADHKYQAPELETLEDHDYAGTEFNDDEGRTFRRRLITTNVSLRNLI
jgi:type II secretory pathway pseudopilin PulG